MWGARANREEAGDRRCNAGRPEDVFSSKLIMVSLSIMIVIVQLKK